MSRILPCFLRNCKCFLAYLYDKVLLHATKKSRFCQNYGGTAKTGLFFGGIVEKNNADFVDNTAKIRYNVGEQK